MNDKEKVITHKFGNITKEFFLIILLWLVLALLFIGLPLIIIFDLNWFLENFYTIFYTTFYISLFIAFLIWIKLIRKIKFKDFILGRPKFPEKGRCWFSYLFIIGTTTIFSILMILLTLNILTISLPLNSFHNIVLLIHLAIGAPIVEEIFFRGYLYHKCEELYEMKKLNLYEQTQKPFRKLQISYAALISSFFFGIYHFNIFTLNFLYIITTAFIGLLFCQFRKEWNSLIPGIIFHAIWNIMAVFIYLTSFNSQNFTLLILVFIITFIFLLLFFYIYFKEDKNHNEEKNVKKEK